MRSRTSLILTLLLLGTAVLPSVAHAAAIPFFGPIVPTEINQCAAGFGMVMVVINNIITFALTVALVFILPITIAYAGFLFVFNPVNPGGRERAKGVLINAIVGIIVALAAWLIVDAVMAALYDSSKTGSIWSQLVTTSGNNCLVEVGALNTLSQTNLTVAGISANGMVVYNHAGLGLCSDANTACSPASLQSAGFSSTQAQVMSCIAGTESSGNATAQNGNAVGLFQIMLTVNPLVGADCGGTLNCPSLCKGNNGAAITTSSCAPCVQAASNPKCNAETAQYLVSQAGGKYSAWTCAGCNNKAASCISQYGG